jgi:hypothetical protein
MLLPNKTKSLVNLLSGNLLGKRKPCVELKQEPHTQLSTLVNLCLSYAISLPWTTLVASKPYGHLCLLSLLCLVLVHAIPMCHVGFLVGCMLSNGVLIKNQRCRDEIESLLGGRHKAVLLGTHWY